MSGDSGVKKRKAIIKDAQHCKRVAISLHSLNTSNVLHDVCFICNRGIKVEAHKLLLCTVSKQLKKMFLELPDTLDKVVIYLPDVDAHIMRLIVDFLYEGSVKVKKNEFPCFQEVMDLLAIELSRPNSEESAAPSTPSQPPQQVQPVAAPQYVYFQAPANSQMQYMMAQPIPPGQVIPAPLMTPVVQGNVAQPSSQPMIIAQPSGQMVQAGAQMVNTQVQQMQVVSQNNQVVPMMASNQMMPANQIVQCSNQIMVQGSQQPMITSNQLQTGNQQTMVNNNLMQTGMKSQSNYSANQTIQQAPQYVMSNSNQMTTSRAPRQVANPIQRSNVTRGRAVQQAVTNTRLTNLNNGRFNTADIMSVLAEKEGDLNSWTAKALRERLEQKLGIDLSRQEEHIDMVLKKVLNTEEPVGSEDSEPVNVAESVFIVCDSEEQVPQAEDPIPTTAKPKKRKVAFAKSDDEADEDFIPTKTKNVTKTKKSSRGRGARKRQ